MSLFIPELFSKMASLVGCSWYCMQSSVLNKCVQLGKLGTKSRVSTVSLTDIWVSQHARSRLPFKLCHDYLRLCSTIHSTIALLTSHFVPVSSTNVHHFYSSLCSLQHESSRGCVAGGRAAESMCFLTSSHCPYDCTIDLLLGTAP